jgi:hypothetical protein
MANKNLTSAKNAKNDEFYTQFADIQKEVNAYLEYDPDVFRGKTIFCNCDDPYESNFFKFFALKFNEFGLKKLIATSYKPSPIVGGQLPLFEIEGLKRLSEREPFAVEITEVKDEDNNGVVNLLDVQLLLKRDKNLTRALKGDGKYPAGDFRSKESVELLKQADFVITNPPFSLFREYVAQLVKYDKKFLIIGNKNALTYKEIFPLIKENKMWVGTTPMSIDILFSVPSAVEQNMLKGGKEGSNYRIVDGKVFGRSASIWFTNIDHGRRHQPLPLMTLADNLKFSKHKEIRGKSAYDRYDNYDAIEVPYTDAIPADYDGVMGVPISFLDKYSPEQFEIVGWSRHNEYNMDGGYWKGGSNDATINGKSTYRRILIKHKKGAK